uniref:DDHD domain-containing protein n=1 Tax=Oncorhynchus tshawytscha TaxID=74940 RepID=A0A8C8EGV2_ONCTS
MTKQITEGKMVSVSSSSPGGESFCMGSPLVVFLALRGIRPGNSGEQDHILPRCICQRLFNVFHPTDPVAYRLEPLILKHYSNIGPAHIHWCSAVDPTPYDEIRPTFINTDTESIPSPSTSPVLARKYYGESIASMGKASILGTSVSPLVDSLYRTFLPLITQMVPFKSTSACTQPLVMELSSIIGLTQQHFPHRPTCRIIYDIGNTAVLWREHVKTRAILLG